MIMDRNEALTGKTKKPTVQEDRRRDPLCFFVRDNPFIGFTEVTYNCSTTLTDLK